MALGDTYNPIGGPGDANNTAYLWAHPELWTQPWTGPRPDGGSGSISSADRQAQLSGSGGAKMAAQNWWDANYPNGTLPAATTNTNGLWNPNAATYNPNTGQYGPSILSGGLTDTNTGQTTYPGGSSTFPEQIAIGQPGGGGPPENVPGAQTSPWPAQQSQVAIDPSTKTGNVKQDWQAFIQARGYTGAQARTQMAQFAQQFNQIYGYNVKPGNPNASGQTDTLDFGDGSGLRDIIHGGDNAWQDIPDNPGSGVSGNGGATTNYDPSIAGPQPGELQNYGVPANQYSSQAYSGGYTAPTWNQSFTAPQLNETTDPGYLARFDLQQRGLERAAAAKGTILNGGTQQATAAFGQDYASNEYANVFSRAFDQYKQKYGEFQNAADLGLRAEQNQYNEYLGNNQRTLTDYLTNYNIGRQGVQDLLTQQNKTADRGLNAVIAGKP